MEIKEKIILVYDNGFSRHHPEDNWREEFTINCSKDLHKAFRELQRKDSIHGGGDSIFDGEVSPYKCSFFKQRYIIIDKEYFVNPIREQATESDIPYFQETFNSFYDMLKRAKKMLDTIQQTRDEKLQDEKDKAQYNELKKKFDKDGVVTQ